MTILRDRDMRSLLGGQEHEWGREITEVKIGKGLL